MSQNIRATPCSSGRQGSTAKVEGSGIAIMSDSSMALNPVIEEPSKPMPPSKASSSSSRWTENDLSWPRTSVNHRRMKRSSRSSTMAWTSSAVLGMSAMRRQATCRHSQPALRPRLEFGDGGPQLLAHGRQPVPRAPLLGLALDEAPGLELLHPLGEEAVGELGDGGADLREAGGPAVHEDHDDRAGPALAHELDGLVVVRTAG